MGTNHATNLNAGKQFSPAQAPKIANATETSAQHGSPHFDPRAGIDSTAESRNEMMSFQSKRDPLMKRFIRWLYPDKRKSDRHQLPHLVAYLGRVRTSEVYEVVDISPAGFYMITHERWTAGTEMPLTLQKTDRDIESITLLSTVVRNGMDGVAFSFALSKDEEPDCSAEPSVWAGHQDLRKFLVAINLLPATESITIH